MAWIIPEYSRGEINRAGKALLRSSDPQELEEARRIVANWRSAHAYPLNGMTMTLVNRARRVAPNRHLVAQRLKRLVSIENKLLRRPDVRATQIQDLGGCRVVLTNMNDVNRMRAAYESGGSRVFFLHRTDDYIHGEPGPKHSGYRSLHLVYRYDSAKAQAWRNMRIELQIRSRAQHSWATAVETVSFFEGQDLKASEGNEDWLRFFVLASHHIAVEEKCPGLPDVHQDYCEELTHLWHALRVDLKLAGWSQSLKIMDDDQFSDANRFVLHLDVKQRTIDVSSVSGGRRAAETSASDMTGQLEIQFASDPDHHIVNVSVDSVKLLKRAYPGFFADTHVFRQAMLRAVGGK